MFAALNILQPLYEACIERMGDFLSEDGFRRTHPNYSKRFDTVQTQIEQHPNQTYYVLKTIMVNNLYGVDIMAEAVEICKLRLFLKLAAQVEKQERRPNFGIEPLPDIDFNVRAGNTLVGFATYEEAKRAVKSKMDFDGTWERIEEEAEDVRRLTTKFRQQQTELGGQVTATDKNALRGKLVVLESTLNRYLAQEYGVNPDNATALTKWRDSHQPFHWFTEFYGIVHEHGGFDVVIGNPPYVVCGKNFEYEVLDYETEDTNDLYAYVMERSIQLSNSSRYLGMIIPISAVSTDGFTSLRKCLLRHLPTSWVSHFAERPSKLFTGVEKRLTIWIGSGSESKGRTTFLSNYQRWLMEERSHLFQVVQYTPQIDNPSLVGTAIPKISTSVESSILQKLRVHPSLGRYYRKSKAHSFYYTRKLRYFVQFFDFVPKITNCQGEVIPPSELKQLGLDSESKIGVTIAALNSSLFFWFLTCFADVRNVNKREVELFPLALDEVPKQAQNRLVQLNNRLMADFNANSTVITNHYKKWGTRNIQSFQPRLSKPIIDQIDEELLGLYQFSPQEHDFIVNFDIKYRMGSELFESED